MVGDEIYSGSILTKDLEIEFRVPKGTVVIGSGILR